ncbi:clavesin-1 [Pectinophora gossypiella]|uniref:clavesin-1 n=1 Tax=Pectinophora gossypiella TaxID=13191 RepID=UPI00214F614C|nr:clavesin-1 [Pectinophora gossypiella]
MSTASFLLTVTTSWGAVTDKCDKEKERPKLNIAEVAAKELRETPATRDQALRIMREWIQQNNDIRNVRTDDCFLLRFLRQKKFSIPMAQQTLLKYLSLKKYYLEYFTNLDCEDPKLEEILRNGYIAVSPVRDASGRRVIVYNMGKFNALKFNCWDMCRAHVLVYETLLEDPMNQVCGFTHVGDGSGASAAHVITWNPSDFARLMKWGEQSMPMRHKEFHIVNAPSALKYIIDFAVSKVTPKMAQRLHIHTNLKQLHKQMDTSCLPTIYGGPIPLQDMIEFTRQLLSDQRKKVLGLDDMELLNTRGIISSRQKSTNGDIQSVQGSFRKLEID